MVMALAETVSQRTEVDALSSSPQLTADMVFKGRDEADEVRRDIFFLTVAAEGFRFGPTTPALSRTFGTNSRMRLDGGVSVCTLRGCYVRKRSGNGEREARDRQQTRTAQRAWRARRGSEQTRNAWSTCYTSLCSNRE